MAMKLVCCCFLAVALFGCLAKAQFSKEPQLPQLPQYKNPPPQPPQRPQKPDNPPKYPPPRDPQRPQTPSNPQPPQPPQKPHLPKEPQKPQPPPDAFHTCEVADLYKIQCGSPGLSRLECETINCCFDGRMCYYGKAVTLQCTKDAQFIIVVARDATLPSIDLETISFPGNGPGCAPVGTTSAFAIYQFPVNACGTTVTDESGTIIYENRITSSFEVAVGPKGAITRDTYYELLVQCRYIGTTIEALVVEVSKVPSPLPVAAPGPLRVELRLGNGACNTKGCHEDLVAYSSFYMDGDYPVSKVLRDPVYVEVQMLERTDPNLVLTLGRCWATSNPHPHSLPQWDLLIDGCPYRDDRYLTRLIPVDSSSGLAYPSHHRRFVFKMFTFVEPETMIPLRELVYIHCDAAVCQLSLTNNCEPRCGSRKRREIAGSVQKIVRQETTLVSSGGISITSPSTE
uniref:Zona pellucida sperm-binding protein 4 n=1 Tax=Amphiprion ocellaris TaxID=80972 RepID=A0AAQ5YZD7_AMPOC